MSDDVVDQQLEQESSDSFTDAIVALAVVCLSVITMVFWVSNQ
jgi:hypothetical protein